MIAAPPNILVAGIGNIFLGDDAFGVEVASRLTELQWPSNVRVVDFGIRGLGLAYALLEGVDIAILVDAAPRGESPGTLHTLEVDWKDSAPAGPSMIEGHSMDPVKVLTLAASMGANVQRVLVVGCEPSPMNEEEMSMGLSPPVQAAVAEAVSMIQSLVNQLGTPGVAMASP